MLVAASLKTTSGSSRLNTCAASLSNSNFPCSARLSSGNSEASAGISRPSSFQLKPAGTRGAYVKSSGRLLANNIRWLVSRFSEEASNRERLVVNNSSSRTRASEARPDSINKRTAWKRAEANAGEPDFMAIACKIRSADLGFLPATFDSTATNQVTACVDCHLANE